MTDLMACKCLCGARFQVGREHSGQQVLCPGCGSKVLVRAKQDWSTPTDGSGVSLTVGADAHEQPQPSTDLPATPVPPTGAAAAAPRPAGERKPSRDSGFSIALNFHTIALTVLLAGAIAGITYYVIRTNVLTPKSVVKLLDEVKDVSSVEKPDLEGLNYLATSSFAENSRVFKDVGPLGGPFREESTFMSVLMVFKKWGAIMDAVEKVREARGEKAAVTALLGLMKEKRRSKNFSDQLVHLNTIFAIGEFGPIAQGAIPELTELANQDDFPWKKVAADAMQRISGKQELYLNKRKNSRDKPSIRDNRK